MIEFLTRYAVELTFLMLIIWMIYHRRRLQDIWVDLQQLLLVTWLATAVGSILPFFLLPVRFFSDHVLTRDRERDEEKETKS